MSGQHQHHGPDRLRVLAAHDPFAAYLYMHSLRSARISAMVSALARFAGRHVKQRFVASRPPKPGEPPFYAALPGDRAAHTGMDGQ
jgi:hypothetical protein